jgi:hypothetical protein
VSPCRRGPNVGLYPELAAKGYRVEAHHFLQKPFTVAKLRELVEGFLSDLRLDPDAMMPLAEIPWCG